MRLKNNTSEFERLREILLHEELIKLKELESKLITLYDELKGEEDIKQRVQPLFDTILSERLSNQDETTVKLLADHLAKVISTASTQDRDSLSSSLQDVISPAISREIKANKETMIDTLYPIMGGMVSKYVTQSIKELMEGINSKIENGLSFERYKRKIKSKITGVSESELMLEEIGRARILSLFVIEKETALLIADAKLKESLIGDPHMVASMASAIKDFINDWVSSNTQNDEIQILSYGKTTLYIESAGSVYLIAFLNMEPNYLQRKEINEFFASLVKEYSEFFQSFDGDDSAPQIVTLKKRMDDYLHREENLQVFSPKGESHFVQYLLIAAALLIAGWFSFWLYRAYQEYRLEKQIVEKTGQTVTLEQKEETLYLWGNVDSLSDAKRIVALAEKESGKDVVDRLSVSVTAMEEVINKKENDILKNQQEREEGIRQRFAEQNETMMKRMTQIEDQLVDRLNKESQRVEKIEKKHLALKEAILLKEEIHKRLQKVFAGERVKVSQKGTLDLSALKLFEAGAVKLSDKDKEDIKIYFERYLSVITEGEGNGKYLKSIIIKGHSDSSGNAEKNRLLSQNRADTFTEYLKTLEVTKWYDLGSKFISQGVADSEPIMINDQEDRDASRRIEIDFVIDETQVLKNVLEILND
jgi:outer membrane protein OmpA-like peptidoglycan-associated protein